MPHETDWADRGIEWRYFGHVTPDEARAADQAFYSDPRSDHAQYQLVDLRDVTQLDFPEPDQRLSAAIDGAASFSVPWVRVAFVVPDGRFDEALETYVELISKTSWSARTFRDVDEARSWCKNDDQSAMVKLRRRLVLDR